MTYLDQFALYIIGFIMVLVAVVFGVLEVRKATKQNKFDDKSLQEIVDILYPQMLAHSIVSNIEPTSLALSEIKVGPGTYYKRSDNEFDLHTVSVVEVADGWVRFIDDETNEEHIVPRHRFGVYYFERTNVPTLDSITEK